ncbi:MAG: DNA polymerase III subunit alpha, partial [Candidatus Firestonebacteria bacterium]
ICTNDTHYIYRHHARLQDILLCIQTGKKVHEENRLKFANDQFFIKTEEEMLEKFGFIPESLKNTLVVAEKCNFKFDENKELILPNFEIPANFKSKEEYLEALTLEGLNKRFKEPGQERINRIKMELEVIVQQKFAGYILIVWDYIKWAKENGVRVGPGRGSVCGSLAAYCLGITEIDPLKYELFFERFLNPERHDPPDIDVDFQDRDKMMKYVTEKYGQANVGQIVTFGTLVCKSAIQNVGMVLDVPFNDRNNIAKMVPAKLPNKEGSEEQQSLLETAKGIKELAELMKKDENVLNIITIASEMVGMTKNTSTHAAGVVISKEPLVNYVPLYKDQKKGTISTQYDMGSLATVGLVKMDFLGLETLNVVDDALKSIKINHGVDIDIDNIDLYDSKTFDLLGEGKTAGVFQFESKGMRDLMRKVKPRDIRDMIALNALYRPGPMEFIDDFIKRKHGLVKIKYDHPVLEPILKETYGIIVYQEQVMQIAVALAGYRLGQAEILRKAMGKKKADVMEGERQRFLKGAKKQGFKAAFSEKTFDLVAKFAGYGFNKAHAAAYSVLAYQTAYLKAHYPREFYAALLSSEIGHTDKNDNKIPGYIEECRKAGIQLVAPDVNRCFTSFAVSGNEICYGLSAIKNVGSLASENIVATREKSGPFKSLADFCARVDIRLLNKRVIESLIKCGGFDSLGEKRLQLMNLVEHTLEQSAKLQQEKNSGQDMLFDSEAMDETMKSFSNEEYPEDKLLGFEKELLGMYLSGHPLVKYEDSLKRFTSANTQTLKNFKEGSIVTLGGIIQKVDKKFTKVKNEEMAILTIEDLQGTVEVLIWPKTFVKVFSKLKEENMVLIKGKVHYEEKFIGKGQPQQEAETGEDDKSGLTVKLYTEELMLLEEGEQRWSKKVHIRLIKLGLEEPVLEKLRTLLMKYNGEESNCQVFLHFVNQNDQELSVVETPIKVRPTREMIAELETLLGESTVWLSA